MRIGLMVGPERNRYATKVQRMIDDAVWAETNGLSTVWIPQVPDEFDAMTAAALIAQATSRIEIGTAVVPLQPRHPVALIQQSLSTQLVAEGRFTLGLGPSHHWIIEDMLGLPYERPAHQMRRYLEVLNAALRGPGQVDVENDAYRVHSPIDVTDHAPTAVLLAALGPVMLRVAGELASGTILWMADERALAEHVVPRITKAAAEAGRPAPRVVVGVPIAICANDEVDDARAWTNRVLGQAEYSPNYQRMLARGDAASMGNILAAGDERAVAARLRAFRDAGATDLAVRVLPFGSDRAARIASRDRTLAFAASLCPTL